MTGIGVHSARAFIVGCTSTSLSSSERSFFAEANPWGLILFQRNCAAPGQVKHLTEQFRDCVGRKDAPVLIDQEGGRVQRLKPPNWRSYPSSSQFGSLYAKDPETGLRAAFNCARLIADELQEAGVSVDCLPVLDVPQPGAHDVIGDRAYGTAPRVVSALGHAAAEGLRAGGVLPVIKHIPGHGRALSDSHESLPVVEAPRDELEEHDFAPFRDLRGYPVAMTAHVVYNALDPVYPATQSSIIVNEVIRKDLGFDGVLLTDDLNMNALSGSLAQRARMSFSAGCDIVLHCNGDLRQMEVIAQESPVLAGRSGERAAEALAMLWPPRDYDVDEALQDLDRALNESV